PLVDLLETKEIESDLPAPTLLARYLEDVDASLRDTDRRGRRLYAAELLFLCNYAAALWQAVGEHTEIGASTQGETADNDDARQRADDQLAKAFQDRVVDLVREFQTQRPSHFVTQYRGELAATGSTTNGHGHPSPTH